jgi:hypothetical protein
MVLESYVATVKAYLVQPILKRRHHWRVRNGRRAVEKTDKWLYWLLLRWSSEWPHHRGTGDKYDEFPSPHGFACAEDTIRYQKNITLWIRNCAVRYYPLVLNYVSGRTKKIC